MGSIANHLSCFSSSRVIDVLLVLRINHSRHHNHHVSRMRPYRHRRQQHNHYHKQTYRSSEVMFLPDGFGRSGGPLSLMLRQCCLLHRCDGMACGCIGYVQPSAFRHVPRLKPTLAHVLGRSNNPEIIYMFFILSDKATHSNTKK
jgi:hypothetical protein